MAIQYPHPPIEPYATYLLKVDAIHTLYVEECGNPKGLPLLYLHGGPGSGCSPDSRCYFNPNIYRIILFDQRGAGRSTPHAELRNNTTQDLVNDIEKIREHLKVERFVLFGGSWGSTLALVYAETYPERVISFILRGIFLARQQDIDWYCKPDGMARIFPESWQALVEHLLPEERNQVLNSYYKRLTSLDWETKSKAAQAFSLHEANCATLLPNKAVVNDYTAPETAVSIACIEAHYMVNHCFLKPNEILNNVQKIAHIPGIIVHGRYDMCCAVDNAVNLHQSWPSSTLHIIPDAGHSSKEPGIFKALVEAVDLVGKNFK